MSPMLEKETATEKVFFKKQANLFRGIEAVGGWLTITEKKMIFNPHALNFQTGVLELYFSDIIRVEKRNTLGIVPNGLKVVLRTGVEYKFVIWKRNEIIEFMKWKINS